VRRIGEEINLYLPMRDLSGMIKTRNISETFAKIKGIDKILKN